MKWGIRIAGLIVLTALVAFVWWFTHRERPAQELTLYGNVDLREVDLAFNNNERIFRVLVTEGDHVRRGQVLARVDTSRLAPQVAQAEANVALDGVNLANARDQYQRNMSLSRNSGGMPMPLSRTRISISLPRSRVVTLNTARKAAPDAARLRLVAA